MKRKVFIFDFLQLPLLLSPSVTSEMFFSVGNLLLTLIIPL